MIHSDNKGLVLPPRVAQIQVVIVPIVFKGDDATTINGKANELYEVLKKAGVRVHLDDSDIHNPGWKFANWEVRGVPIRLELGKKDLEKQEVKVVRRDNGEKAQYKVADLATTLATLLTKIHDDMYNRAVKERDEHIIECSDWAGFMNGLNGKNLCLTPWCNEQECEVQAKE